MVHQPEQLLPQIRNLVFDMTGMAFHNFQGDQKYVPTGIHWQVGQATSITNCDFKMAMSEGIQNATAIGIAMENGSGGTVSDLTFVGGNIGFVAGSQQFTATNLKFTSCQTAIKHIWNWGFTWKNIYVESCHTALDCTMYSDVTSQGNGVHHGAGLAFQQCPSRHHRGEAGARTSQTSC